MLCNCKFNVSLLTLDESLKTITMKADEDKVVLSVTYSILDPSSDKSKTKHFYAASNKKKLRAKIKSFEMSLKPQKTNSFYQRSKAYIKNLIKSWNYTQKEMFRI